MANESLSSRPAAGFDGISEAISAARARARVAVTHAPREPDAYDRIDTRCRGLQSVLCLASIEKEEDTLNPRVWQSLFLFMEQVADDIARDAEELWREGRELWKEGQEAARKDDSERHNAAAEV